MSVHPHYRAVLFGEEHIVKGWRGRKLLTNKGNFTVRHIYGDWPIQNCRLFEVAAIQADGNGGWLINGKPLSMLKEIKNHSRFEDIPGDENLRVYKEIICAVAFVQIGERPCNHVTSLLDEILDFWEYASSKANVEKVEKSDKIISAEEARQQQIMAKFRQFQHESNIIGEVLHQYLYLSKVWSKPIWLTEFRPAGGKVSKPSKQIEAAKDTLQIPQASQTAKVEAAPAPQKIAPPKNQQSAPPDREYFLSYKEAAKFIGVSERTIKNWKKRSWLKVEKVGKKSASPKQI